LTLPVDTAADRNPRPVGFRAPPGSCDTHFHVFEHSPRYPFSPARAYTPAVATNEAYRHMLHALGLERAVLVHPTTYGTDNSLLLDVLRDHRNYRGIAVVDFGVTDAQLEQLDRAGVRGIRITAVSAGGVPLAQLDALCARIAPLGWHAQLFVRAEMMLELAPRLPELPVPVVLDHFGGLTAAHAGSSRELDTLLGLLGSGRIWVKLSAVYRASLEGPPYRDMLPIARAIIDKAPDRLLWGSDWPHPNLRGKPMPNDGDLLGLLAAWAPEELLRRRILADNPAVLYGF
jgi:predicted TIM-barrel fold metal-dependent hydrolase